MESESDQGPTSGSDVDAVCSLCGDIGFRDALILCRKCGFRHQHMYCSRYYPNINVENWSCEWCIHEEEKQANRRSKVFEFLLEIAQSLPESSPVECQEKRISPRDQEPTAEEKLFTAGNIEVGSETKENKRTSVKRNARCIEKNKALDRWRNLAKNRLSCRRYKLLADVLC